LPLYPPPPESGLKSDIAPSPLSANNGSEQLQKGGS
jgi:hypothetical protein